MTYCHANRTEHGWVGIVTCDAEGDRPLYESWTVAPTEEAAERTAVEEWRDAVGLIECGVIFTAAAKEQAMQKTLNRSCPPRRPEDYRRALCGLARAVASDGDGSAEERLAALRKVARGILAVLEAPAAAERGAA